MKKKLTINTLALGNLKQRRKQYTIMIIGIILAMVFSSSSIFFVYSMRDSAIEQSKIELGNQYRIDYIVGADENDYEDMKNEGFYSEYGLAHNIGYAYSDKLNKGSQVAWLDDDCKAMAYIRFLEGEYPKNENEVAVEKSALINLGYDNAQIGDTLTLNFKIQDEDKYLEKAVVKEYKLVGVLVDKKQNMLPYFDKNELNPIVPAIFVAQNTSVDMGGKEQLICYRNRPNIGSSDKAWQKFFEDEENYYREHNYSVTNLTVGVWYDLALGNGTNISSNLNFITLLSVVLMIASCLSIINAFNSTLKQRKKQIGMLRAIGATKRQIINIFGREALIISLVSIPISIAVSYGLVNLMSGMFGDEFVVSKNYQSLIACVAVNLIVVMLSAFIPLLNASKTTPMQAIRNINNNRKMKTKRIKSQKSYDMPSLLAKRYRMFYKSSNTVVCIILSLTIALSCFGMGVASGILDDEFLGYGYDYGISVMGDGYGYSVYNIRETENGFTNTERQSIDAIQYVGSTNAYKQCNANILVDGYDDYYKCIKGVQEEYGGSFEYSGIRDFDVDNFAEKCLGDMSAEYYSNKQKFGFTQDYVTVTVYAFDESVINSIEAYDGSVNISRLNSGEEVILLAPKKVAFELNIKGDSPTNGWSSNLYCDDNIRKANKDNIVLQAESDFKAGEELPLCVLDYEGSRQFSDELDMKQMKTTKKSPKIGAVVSPTRFSNAYEDFAIITTIKGIENFSKNQTYDKIEINCNTEITPQIEEYMSFELEKLSSKNEYADVTSSYKLRNEKEQQQRIWYLVVISVTILSFAICVGIINNTITANIVENKKEMGTLRAVGASERELVISYIKQLLSIFGIGYGVGFGLYGIYLLFEYIDEVVVCKGDFSLKINPWLTIVFCVLLFAICSANLWIKIRKEMKNSIVENIREL
ncbi:MAG: FtsX-like permease family protein [Eubacteriales bacterium]|nr:FtsX-like permease family protein [Eubacteriales bacterium]